MNVTTMYHMERFLLYSLEEVCAERAQSWPWAQDDHELNVWTSNHRGKGSGRTFELHRLKGALAVPEMDRQGKRAISIIGSWLERSKAVQTLEQKRRFNADQSYRESFASCVLASLSVLTVTVFGA